MKKQKGITLIALIITIIVMLILVGVSVTVALNGGLFETAKKAAEGTQAERDEELLMTEDGYIEAVQNRIAVGTEVTIGETGENFYVIKDEGAKLVLLAKYNLKADGENWVQDTSGAVNECAFSNINYWSSVTDETKYPLNLNTYPIPEKVDGTDVTSIITVAKEYGEELGGTGRLMTYEEAEPLSESEDEEILKILYGTYTDGAYLDYWLGSAYDPDFVWCVNGYDSYLYGDGGCYLNGDIFDYDSDYGVRPVVVISESSVEIVP